MYLLSTLSQTYLDGISNCFGQDDQGNRSTWLAHCIFFSDGFSLRPPTTIGILYSKVKTGLYTELK